MNTELYQQAIGKKVIILPPSPEEQEKIDHQKLADETLHNNWMHDPMTQKFLADTENTYKTIIDSAINFAQIGQDATAARNLIKAKTLKEVINYVRRNKDNSSGNIQ